MLSVRADYVLSPLQVVCREGQNLEFAILPEGTRSRLFSENAKNQISQTPACLPKANTHEQPTNKDPRLASMLA